MKHTEEITLEQYRALTATRPTPRTAPAPAVRRCDGTRVGDWTPRLNERVLRAGWRGVAFRGDMHVCAWRVGERTAYYETMAALLAALEEHHGAE